MRSNRGSIALVCLPPGRLTRRRRVADWFVEFFQLEASGGIVLLAATTLAVGLANSEAASSMSAFWAARGPLGLSIQDWINDGLMALFFFVVGLEIKREILAGELSSIRRASLPLIAALGGMVAPALIYRMFNLEGPGQRGWGIATATDIAFSLGVLALLGSRIPPSLKVFLAALAIADDLGAVLVIAIFYSGQIQIAPLLWAASLLLAIVFLNRRGYFWAWTYALGGGGLWLLVHESGLHATLAGVALAAAVPSQPKRLDDLSGEPGRTPIESFLHILHPWATYGIVPLFALANAGIRLEAGLFSGPIAWGAFWGLLVGKPLGILGLSFVAVRLRVAALPRNVGWIQLAAVGALAGIGFTMSLFIAELAFGPGESLQAAKAGVFAASLIAAIAGYSILRGFGGLASKPSSEP